MTLDELRRVAGSHLPPDVARRWLGLMRPGRQLESGPDEGPVVGRPARSWAGSAD
ncbi:hypothetical protein [Streptomyces odontomachi]|uniref:hypothetical protein n=1 Tax=Streptomyces odontomachi TaxID=2944940 RepID=UPI00210EB15E|nr:hypothetical protein [Streptomyces sp. ODS25]